MALFLCTADLHIGRQSSGFDGETALEALCRIVDLAIEGHADGLLIAGDLFDSIDAQFLTRSYVASALERLKAKGIPVLVVAGNHDWDAMPTFVYAYPGLIELFGADSWSVKELAGVAIVGRSFGAPTAKTLIEDFPSFGEDRVTIGLLHADIDTKSTYNPTPLTALGGRGVHAWVLGHVHSCRHWQNPLAVYPGSPQALDAGESGVHGVRWLSVEGTKISISETVPLSTARFEAVELEIRPEQSIDEVVITHLSQIRHAGERLSLRVRLRRFGGASQPAPDGIVPLGQDFYEIVDCVDAIELSLDLEREAEQTDARGQAARLLLGLEKRGNQAWIRQAEALVAQVRGEMEVARGKLKLGAREEFAQLANPDPDESLRAVRASLESVLAAAVGGAR